MKTGDYRARVTTTMGSTVLSFVNDAACGKGWVDIDITNVKETSQTVADIEDDNLRMLAQIESLVEELQSVSKIGSKKYSTPSILVICPDTYNVVDLNKLLTEKFKDLEGKKESESKYDIHISKLFAKHIKPEEQAKQLA